jgi:AraC-like DNA-binding protein
MMSRDRVVRGLVRSLANATGLLVRLERPFAAGVRAAPCTNRGAGSALAADICKDHRKKLLGKLDVAGGSAVEICPIGGFCVAAMVWIGGSPVAFLRAGGFSAKTPGPSSKSGAVAQILELVASEIGRRVTALLGEAAKQQDTMRKAFLHLEQNFYGKIGMQELATAAGVSRQHLARLWKRETGITLHEHLNALRVVRACELLVSTNHKIIDVSMDCGFGSVSQFNRSFRKATGISPREYAGRTH